MLATTKPLYRIGLALLATLLLIAGTTAATPPQAKIHGEFTARSMDSGPVDASMNAYLIGLPTNYNNPPASAWTFKSEQVEVVETIETWLRVGIADTQQDTRTERTVYESAHGVLLDTDTMAYLSVTSSAPDDPRATTSIQTKLPDTAFAAESKIHYDASYSDTDQFTIDSQINREYRFERDWSNLVYNLDAPTQAIKISGDFRVVVFDMDFRVQNASESKEYSTGHGGHRGLDDPPPPAEEYEDVRAELVFRNATFTLYPKEHPVELYLADTQLDTHGPLMFERASGSLSTTQQKTPLDRSLLEIHGDATIQLSPVDDADSLMLLGTKIEGEAEEIIIDGNNLFAPTDMAPSPTPQTSNHWLFFTVAPIAILLALAMAARTAENIQVKHWPEAAGNRAKRAMDRGRFHRAKVITSHILSRHPKNATAIAVHASSVLQQGTPETAAEILEPFIATPTDRGALSLIYCIALQAAGKTEQAKTNLHRAIERFPPLIHEIRGTDLEYLYHTLPSCDGE